MTQLAETATHTSGLPRLPPGMLLNALPAWSTNPYSGYSGEHLLHALARTRIRARPGSRVRYSNYGVGILGRLLADTAGMGYPQLLSQRVCAPLGLSGTRCEPDPLTQATGHRRGRALPPWSMPGLPGAGAVRSTGMPVSALGGAALAVALRDVQQPRFVKPRSQDRLCLIWNLRRRGPYDVLFHSGATRGFTAFVGFCPQAGVAVAALANNAVSLRCRFVQTAYDLLRSLIHETR